MSFNRPIKVLSNLILVALIFSVMWVTPVHAAGVLYVTQDGMGDCSAWVTSCSLQTALTTSVSGDEIWVVAGTYKPTSGSDRNATFQLKAGVSVYGGFFGNENLRSQRDYLNNITILSGDLNSDDIGFNNNSENAYHVVSGADGAALDGITIMAGNAADSSGDSSGGGVLLYSGTLSITNSIISRNSATYGGGIFNASGTLNITGSTFSDNRAISFYASCGGAIFNTGVLTIRKSVFSGNTADAGGGIWHQNGSLSISTSTFFNNNADSGGGLKNFSPLLTTITNSTFTGNSVTYHGSSIYNNGKSLLTITSNTFSGDSAGHGSIYNYNGTLNVYNNILANSADGDCVNGVGVVNANNNLIEDAANACGMNNGVNGNIVGSDPGLGMLTGSPAHFPLNNGSLAIDAGDDAKCPVTDQRGVARPYGSHCDIGAYELDIPQVKTITRVDVDPTSLASVQFTVTFSEPVTGVDKVSPFNDFYLTVSPGLTGAYIVGVSGSNGIYTVSINTGSGNGTVRLDVVDNNSIVDAASNPLGGAAVGDGNFTSGEVYTIIKSATFADVPLNYWANNYIERLYNAGVTGGCGTGSYCPDSTVTRAQMAIFLLKGMHGSGFTPPAVGVSTGFGDVATSYWAAPWIKQLAAEGITGGCGNGNYCPDNTVTRAQMAIFLLKAKHGSSYSPPNAAGVFTDVPVGYWADKWIEQLAAEGITGGCGSGNYCPDAEVTRAQMAVFLVKAFNLP